MTTRTCPIQSPMRPMMGVALTADNVGRLLDELLPDWVVQPKLNGDRVVLRKVNGSIETFNRHQSWYSFNVNALDDWADLPDGITLDGEGYRGRFYPFEVVGPEPVEERVAEAKRICRSLGMPWIFDTPTQAWLARCRENLPQWEGVVIKRRGCGYKWLHKPTYTSVEWTKLKW